MVSDWISASEAFRLVSDASTPYLAPRSICSRAHAGLVAARAKRLIIGGSSKDDADVPAKFWWARGEAALEQNWTTGDFETWYDRQVHCLAYGVEFARADIEAMLPSRSNAPAIDRGAPGNYAPASQCLEELKSALKLGTSEIEALLVRHCRAGMLPSRCSKLWWRLTTRYGDEEDEAETNVAIPDWVWEECLSKSDAVLNWPANAFAGEGTLDGDRVKVKVTGVEFEVGAVVAVENLARSTAAAHPVDHALPASSAPGSRGRRLSEHWTPWVAELASIIHEHGIPPGAGSQGQEELIRKISDALATRGVEGPSRSTVQPVVQAVLDRLRSAGN